MGPRGYLFALGLLVAGGVVLAMGGQKTLIAMKNSSPTQMKYSEWAAASSDAEWVELTDVYIDWSASARIDTEHKRKGRTTNTTKEYFVAAWASSEDKGPVKCFFVVEDAGKQQFMEQAWSADERKDENWYVANAERLTEVRTVSGLVRTGFDLSSDDEKILRGMGNVAPEFRIIDMDGKPAGGTGMLMILGGIALMGGGGALGFFTFRSGRKKVPLPPGYTNSPRLPVPGQPYGPGQQPGPAQNHPQPPASPGAHPYPQPVPANQRPLQATQRPALPTRRPPQPPAAH